MQHGADKNNACTAVDIGQCHTLIRETLVACTILSKALKPISSLYSTTCLTPDASRYRSRASLVKALVVLAQCLCLHTLAHKVAYVVGLQQGG